MRILNQYPPNYDAITAVLKPNDKTIFCYGDTIYNPHGRNITPDLEVHESIHSRQQGSDPEKWWYNYLTDPAFRLEKELEAYGEQFLFAKKHVQNPKLIAWAKEQMALALSGESYGNLISYGEAESKIRNYQKDVRSA